MRSLDNYLARIGVSKDQLLLDEAHQTSSSSKSKSFFKNDHATLATIMEGHLRNIPFENFDIVMNKNKPLSSTSTTTSPIISMSPEDVETKLVDNIRGGYCWEQNTLLQMALEEIGYQVTPIMCRVRYGRSDEEDANGPTTPLTHLALVVSCCSTRCADGKNTNECDDDGTYLADVGFGGMNSMHPISLKSMDLNGEPQTLPEGQFRTIPSKHKGYRVLQFLVKESTWQSLFEWRHDGVKAPIVDQECANWYSYTYPTARFTTQLFASCLINDNERHYILNETYVIQKGYGKDREKTTEIIGDKARLLELIDSVFGVKLIENDGIDYYLIHDT